LIKQKLFPLFFAFLALPFALRVDARHASQTPATVAKVIDGDMLKIEIQGCIENIRLIGIDTPESKKNKKAVTYEASCTAKVKVDNLQLKEPV
jgi:micrococcal nuclease